MHFFGGNILEQDGTSCNVISRILDTKILMTNCILHYIFKKVLHGSWNAARIHVHRKKLTALCQRTPYKWIVSCGASTKRRRFTGCTGDWFQDACGLERRTVGRWGNLPIKTDRLTNPQNITHHGYDTYFEGLKPSFFMVLVSKDKD